MNRRVKYSRTAHLPWSEGSSSDDILLKHCSDFDNREIVVTEKLDGENTTIYSDAFVHARSIDSSHHESRSWLKRYAATFSHDIPFGHRICGENLYAYHSIFYSNLPSYFLAFGIYNEDDLCLSWDDTVFICEALGVSTVPVIYRGIWDVDKIKKAWTGQGTYPTFDSPEMTRSTNAEGYVVRLADEFHKKDFNKYCAKYVRKNHVQTDQHWMNKSVVRNLTVADAVVY